MSGKASRDKGHNFEREVARLLRVSFPDSRRGDQAHNARASDIEGTPFRIECKRYKQTRWGHVKDALAQAEGDAYDWEDDRPCLAITRADREPAYVTMSLGAFLSMVEKMFWREPDNVIEFPGWGQK